MNAFRFTLTQTLPQCAPVARVAFCHISMTLRACILDAEALKTRIHRMPYHYLCESDLPYLRHSFTCDLFLSQDCEPDTG